MISIRRAVDRGHANHGWLDTHHTFSFANYYHPDHMGYRALRVINEDRINPGAGFPTHPHENMEIITYVLEGALAHKDSTGGGGVITPGMVQYMSAGSGVTHSEFNASDTEPLHLYQIWLLPNEKGAAPRYEEREVGDARNGGLKLIASPDGRDGSFAIRQDASLYASIVKEGETLTHDFGPGRYGWLQVAKGGVEIGGLAMQPGDGAKIAEEEEISFTALADSEVLLFDLP
ncbi:pirin family protein [Hyphococcus luteus]|uniref:Quercetin 2,3-dioxygenase n=1 Tax=Hyphococcus luteus TaxID=2058213 RepID=A0A2S7K5S9_9PROT|nr:pirin family protein [Marinicaulis flavus]PQA87857.1 quercetin 2,3-dioxygenase [Marinicaulis flavus]